MRGVKLKMEHYNKTTQEIIKRVSCPYQVFLSNTTVEEVNQAYHKSFEQRKKEVFVPVLVISDSILLDTLEILEEPSYSKEALLQQELDGEKILQEYMKYHSYFQHDFQEDPSEFFQEELNYKRSTSLSSFRIYGDKEQIKEMILFEVPVQNPWEVIAWIPMGNWNACPNASDMMAICKKWYQTCGAIPAVISHDTLEFFVKHPVKEKQTAWELAKEHCLFCPDTFDIDLTLKSVAEYIYQASIWHFWWD